MTLVSVVDTLQHAVKHDTVLVHDTVRVVDTVRVLVHEGGASTLAIVGVIVAAASAAGAGAWKLLGWGERRQQAHLRINAEAFSLHRELVASIGSGPKAGQSSTWAAKCQAGFNGMEGRFDRLTEMALNAKSKVRRVVGRERRRFLDAANVVNEARVGAWDHVKEQAMNGVHGEFQLCVDGLSRVIKVTEN